MQQGFSIFTEGQLRHVRREVIKMPMPEYDMANGRIVPLATGDNAIPRGADTYLFYIQTMVGEAKVISNPADDLPTADIFSIPQTGIVHDVGDSYRYSDKDLERAQFGGVNLTVSKAAAAKQAAMIKLEKIGYVGDSAYNLLGLINQPNVPTASVMNDGLGGSTRWADKTPVQVVRDMRDMVTAIPIETNLFERPDTLLIPPTEDFYLRQTFIDPLNTTTLLEAFFKTQGADGIQNVQPAPYLAGAGPNNTGAAVVFKRREDKVKLHVPVLFYPKVPQERNFHYVVPCRYTTGGVEVSNPMSIRIFYGL